MLGERDTALRDAGVTTRFLCAMSGTEVLLEAIFDWRDEIGPFRASLLVPGDRDELETLPPAPAARELVRAVRRELSDVYDALGAVHLQIAKYYPYRQLMHGPTRELLEKLKRSVDPEGRMSPGNLGF